MTGNCPLPATTHTVKRCQQAEEKSTTYEFIM